MKTTYKYSLYMLVGMLLFIFTGCNDSDDYNVGSQTDPNSPGVYFVKMDKPSISKEADESEQLKLSLERVQADKSIRVPIKVVYAPVGLVVPAEVAFEANQTQADLVLDYTDEFKQNEEHAFKLEIDQAYARPYDETIEGTSMFQGKLTVFGAWDDYLTARVKFVNKSSGETPVFGDFEQKILKRGSQYRIDNFMLNNEGYTFDFSLDPNKQILPLDYVGYHDTAALRWYFYKGPSSSSSNRIPCYLPATDGTPKGDYITYAYFYTVGSSDSRYAFEFDEYTKTAKMAGYARYSESSSGAFLLEFSWD